MPKSPARRAYEAATRAQLRAMFAEAGTTFERRADGRVAVTNWPELRKTFGGGSFLRRELDSHNEEKARRRAACAAEGYQPCDDAAAVCRRCRDQL